VDHHVEDHGGVGAAAATNVLVKLKLDPPRSVPVFMTMRRWARKQLTDGIPARIQETPARIVDIGYGGLRFELACRSVQTLPLRFHLDLLGSGLILPLELVWTVRAADRWLCGAAVPEADDDLAGPWRTMVDTIP